MIKKISIWELVNQIYQEIKLSQFEYKFIV